MRNKRLSIFLFFLGLMLISLPVFSQRDTIIMPHNTWDTVYVDPAKGAIFYDNGGPYVDEYEEGEYARVSKDTITICPQIFATPGAKLQFVFTDFVLAQSRVIGSEHCDTLFFYNGPSVDSPPFTIGHYNFMTQLDNPASLDSLIFIDNDSGCFTVRFWAEPPGVDKGWEIKIDVRLPCQKVNVELTDNYLVSKGGGPLVSQPYKYRVNNDTTDTRYIDICLGDSIVVESKFTPAPPVFYEQVIDSLLFVWDHGDRQNTTEGKGVSSVGIRYSEVKAYAINLNVYDQNGCTPDSLSFVKVRISQNPIREVPPLADICTGQEGQLKVGYQGAGHIVLNRVVGSSFAQKKFTGREFIPDGGLVNGAEAGACYETTVTFVEFGNARIKSPTDINTVCIRAEHSAIGDLQIALKCPEGQMAYLKEMTWNDFRKIPYVNPEQIYMFGIPYGGTLWPSAEGDSETDYSNPDANPSGIGWPYCWAIDPNDRGSNNMGVMDTTELLPSYRLDTVTYDHPDYKPIPHRVLDTSDYEGRNKFFLPSGDFQSLIGCSLNGDWTIVICDRLVKDNGYIFEWFMDLSSSELKPWSYAIEVDTVMWTGDGLTVKDNLSASILHTEAGTHTYGVTLVDEIGCVWDTIVNQVAVKTPDLDLGGDTVLCNVVSLTLDAGNNSAYKYRWDPNGETTSSIQTDVNIMEDQYYSVDVTNSRFDPISGRTTTCAATDSFLVRIGSRPLPRFSHDKPEPHKPLEGCEPFDVYFRNVSKNAVSYLWDFGDGETSTEENPKHEYKAGKHPLTLYATSSDGCEDADSLIVYVYSKPKPDFYWDPMYPTLKQPITRFINKTTPESDENVYLWKVQVDKNNPNSLKYIVDSTNVTFQWNSSVDNLAQGIYNVELRAATKNIGPSANVYECADSVSYDIRVINDFLQFPNVVTPNGDGINDVFKITSLLEGMAFPKNELAIYTRNGKRIFYKKDIKVESDFWDPKDTNTPPGTYIYRFVGKGYDQDVEYSGTIEVLTK